MNRITVIQSGSRFLLLVLCAINDIWNRLFMVTSVLLQMLDSLLSIHRVTAWFVVIM